MGPRRSDTDTAATGSEQAAGEALIRSQIQQIGEEHFPGDEVQWSVTGIRNEGPFAFAEVLAVPATTGYDKYLFVLRSEVRSPPAMLACYCWDEGEWNLLSTAPEATAAAGFAEAVESLFQAPRPLETSGPRARLSRRSGHGLLRSLYAMLAAATASGLAGAFGDLSGLSRRRWVRYVLYSMIVSGIVVYTFVLLPHTE